MTSNEKAHELNERGRDLAAKEWFAEAERAYREAAAAAPSWATPWYNLGLMQKYRSEWRSSFDCNLRAVQLDESSEAAWWNLGIAATALDEWQTARRAWRACGIDIPDGDGPLDLDFGLVPIRLNGTGDSEVVWARRLDPARATLLSIPLPGSGHRWNDVVLHDGAANGYRKLRGRDVPVFDELTILTPSTYNTYVVELSAPRDAIDALSAIAETMGGFAEDWSTNTRLLCKECSEGNPGHLHDATHTTPAHPCSGIAARSLQHAEQMLDAWKGEDLQRAVQSIRAAELVFASDKGLAS